MAMTDHEFYQHALIAAMQGLLTAAGHTYDEDEIEVETDYEVIAELAQKYAKALIIKNR